jgi:hypothetical protein
MRATLRTIPDLETEPSVAEFVEFFDAFVGSHQVTENWCRLGLTFGRHARQIRNTNDPNNVTDPNWPAHYVFAR